MASKTSLIGNGSGGNGNGDGPAGARAELIKAPRPDRHRGCPKDGGRLQAVGTLMPGSGFGGHVRFGSCQI